MVVVAIIALALTVAIPWILQSSVSTLQNHNRNQVKQIGLALQNHAEQFKVFPPLFFSSDPVRQRIFNPQLAAECYPWQVRLLPFLEEDKLYRDIERASQKFGSDSTQVRIPDPNNAAKLISPSQVSISVWQSPHLSRLAPGECHYAALPSTRLPLLLNTITYDKGERKTLFADGMIVPDRNGKGTSMARMADGTSKTALFNETRERQRSNWFLPQQSFVCGFLPSDSTPVGNESGDYYPYFPYPDWHFNPQHGDRTAINHTPYHQVTGDPLARAWGPSGTHPEGKMLVGMGDGSTVEIDSSVEPLRYFAAITARAGEFHPEVDAKIFSDSRTGQDDPTKKP